MDQVPLIIVLTGLPGSGKSRVAAHMAERHGCLVVSRDDLRRDIFDQSYSEWLRSNDKHGRLLLDEIVDDLKDRFLRRGRSVVIDSVAPSDEFRAHHFSITQPAERWLIWLCADAKVLRARLALRSRDAEGLEFWQERWVDPQPRPEYALIKYNTDTPEEISRMLDDLDNRLTHKPGIARDES
jgi:predicted kinase